MASPYPPQRPPRPQGRPLRQPPVPPQGRPPGQPAVPPQGRPPGQPAVPPQGRPPGQPAVRPPPPPPQRRPPRQPPVPPQGRPPQPAHQPDQPYRQPQARPQSRRDRKRAEFYQRERAKEARWAANRWAVPYRTDGPKVTFGVIWFVLIIGSSLFGLSNDNPRMAATAVAIITAVVAGLAGLQTGFSWFPRLPVTRTWTASVAAVMALLGVIGPWGVPLGVLLAVFALGAYVMIYRGHRRSAPELLDVLARSAIPVGLAAASMGALASRNLPAFVALVMLVSAYEVGDYLVGSGASNAIEGPLAGIIGLGVVAFFLFLIEPEPFSSESTMMFSVATAVSCVLGQYAASGLLPRGAAWAPALRRLDSYLLAAPLWLLLLVLLPDAH